MQTIGLIGGMSWESTLPYYRLVNEATRDRLGGLHSADCLLRSVDFTEIDLLVGPQDAPVPVFDTTRLHAQRAVELALAG